MKQIFKHEIDYSKVAKGLGISKDLAVKFFNDGRIIGRLGEFILEDKDVGKRSDNEGTSYDNITDDKIVFLKSISTLPLIFSS